MTTSHAAFRRAMRKAFRAEIRIGLCLIVAKERGYLPEACDAVEPPIDAMSAARRIRLGTAYTALLKRGMAATEAELSLIDDGWLSVRLPALTNRVGPTRARAVIAAMEG